MEILEKAQRMLEKYPLCNHCLGRQFALLGYGLENQTRGEAIKLLLTMKAHQLMLENDKAGIVLLKTLAIKGVFPTAMEILRIQRKRTRKPKQCHLCNGKMECAVNLSDNAVKLLQDYEFSTFLVGIKLPADVEEREDEFKAEFDLNFSESMRNELSRVIGKTISELSGNEVEFKKPDITVLINPFTKHIALQVNPLHISGRYKKFVRGVSQSRWICSRCRGKGCERCNWTGKMYAESVEDFIAKPALEMTEGQTALFHGSGREDVDARMLGRGRPFVLEVKTPKKRFIDLEKLEKKINKDAAGKVEVHGLRFADKDLVRRLKRGESSQKTYRVIMEFERVVSDEELAKLEGALKGIAIYQQTPQRVLHRRADRIREKYIYEAKVKRLTLNSAQLRIRCQGGLYVKELVTGDEGRTKPSVAEILGTKATPIDLDVLSVIMRETK
jgi:tRNA pseudouridine synthase 10